MEQTGKDRTPGGSLIVDHGRRIPETRIDTNHAVHRYTEEREAAYEKIFGKALSVSHELLPLVPHVDVYTFRRSQAGREVYALVTGGMSDLQMNVPSWAEGEINRAELVFYCSEPNQ